MYIIAENWVRTHDLYLDEIIAKTLTNCAIEDKYLIKECEVHT